MSQPTQVWSCGGGTQSGAIAVLIAQGKLPRPDFAFACGGCKAVIGNWRGLWVSLDSWTIAHVRDNKRFEL